MFKNNLMAHLNVLCGFPWTQKLQHLVGKQINSMHICIVIDSVNFLAYICG